MNFFHYTDLLMRFFQISCWVWFRGIAWTLNATCVRLFLDCGCHPCGKHKHERRPTIILLTGHIKRALSAI